jgi:hypothetical protein
MTWRGEPHTDRESVTYERPVGVQPNEGFTAPAACAKTTASETLTWSSDDENESSRNSKIRDQLSASFPPIRPSITPSTSNLI